jgi:hypothetical protein
VLDELAVLPYVEGLSPYGIIEWAALRLSLNWRAINAPNQLKLLLSGQHFHDGQLVLNHASPPVQAAA